MGVCAFETRDTEKEPGWQARYFLRHSGFPIASAFLYLWLNGEIKAVPLKGPFGVAFLRTLVVLG